jgi:hypothetical protein
VSIFRVRSATEMVALGHIERQPAGVLDAECIAAARITIGSGRCCRQDRLLRLRFGVPAGASRVSRCRSAAVVVRMARLGTGYGGRSACCQFLIVDGESGNWLEPILAQGFPDAHGARASGALVDRECVP